MVVAFNGRDERKSSILPLLTGVAGAAAGGYFIGDAIGPKHVLAKDEFVLNKIDARAEKALKGKEGTYEALAAAAKSANTEAVNAEVAKYIAGEAKDIDAQKFFNDYLKTDIAKYTAEKDALKTKTESLIKAVQDAPDAAAKKLAKAQLDAHKINVSTMENILGAIKGDKISKESIADFIKCDLKGKASTQVEGILKGLGEKLPKVFSGKKAIIGALVGLVAGSILAGPKSKE